MNRAEFWYIFGLAAVVLLLLRLRPTRRADLRDPIAISFTFGLFLGAFGTLSKQPAIAVLIDVVLGPNAAWLVADSLFLVALCFGTFWVDLMRMPSMRQHGWRLVYRWRVAALLVVIGWMTVTTLLATSTWQTLERGGIGVSGHLLLLSERLAYFAYSLWGLAYLSFHFYRQRQHMRDRFNYIRLTIAWSGITLAIAAPALQVAGTLRVFAQPELLPVIWPSLGLLLSLAQLGVAVSIVTTFFPPAYRSVVWIDKQLLVHRLSRARSAMARSRPDLLQGQAALGPAGLVVRDPDRWLATLVNEFEMAKWLMGKMTYEIEAPAGGVMPDVTRYALRDEQAQFLRGLTSTETLTIPKVTGDFYALARWYASVGNVLL